MCENSPIGSPFVHVNDGCHGLTTTTSRGEIFRALPIRDLEVMAFFNWGWRKYQNRLESGKIPRSIDLSDMRPGAFLFHSYWDIVEAGIVEYFEKARPHAALNRRAVDGAIDIIASEVDILELTRNTTRMVSPLSAQDFSGICAACGLYSKRNIENIKRIFLSAELFVLNCNLANFDFRSNEPPGRHHI